MLFQLSYVPAKADWSGSMRGIRLQSCVPLNRWLLVFVDRPDGWVAREFFQILQKVAPPMGGQVAPPELLVFKLLCCFYIFLKLCLTNCLLMFEPLCLSSLWVEINFLKICPVILS